MYSFRGLLENAAGVLEKCAGTSGARDPAPVACKERHIQLVFETADLAAEIQSCQAKTRDGARTVRSLGRIDRFVYDPVRTAHDRSTNASHGGPNGMVLAACG